MTVTARPEEIIELIDSLQALQRMREMQREMEANAGVSPFQTLETALHEMLGKDQK